MTAEAWVILILGITTAVGGAGWTLAGILWRSGTTWGQVKAAIDGLTKALDTTREWLKDVAAGNTAAHAAVVGDIKEHERRLDDHDEQLGQLQHFRERVGAAHERQHGEAVL